MPRRIVQSIGASSAARSKCTSARSSRPCAVQERAEPAFGARELLVGRRPFDRTRRRQRAVAHPRAELVVVHRRIDAGEVLEHVVDRRDHRRAHDAVVLVDPDRRRHVRDAEPVGDDVLGIDERRMRRRRGLDPFARGVGLVERDRHDRATERFELDVQCLPPGQVVAAASPRRPGDEHLLLAPDRAPRERLAVDVGEHEIVDAPVRQLSARVAADAPSAASPVSSSNASGCRTRSATTRRSTRSSTRIVGPRARRHAHVAAAQTFGVELPAGDVGQLVLVQQQRARCAAPPRLRTTPSSVTIVAIADIFARTHGVVGPIPVRDRTISTITSPASSITAIHAGVRARANSVGHSKTDGYR